MAEIAAAAVAIEPKKLKGSVPQIVVHLRAGQETASIDSLSVEARRDAAESSRATEDGPEDDSAESSVIDSSTCDDSSESHGIDSRAAHDSAKSLAKGDADVSHDSAESSASIADATVISMTTARRLSCDAAVVMLYERANGEPLSIGRRSRTIPAAIRGLPLPWLYPYALPARSPHPTLG